MIKSLTNIKKNILLILLLLTFVDSVSAEHMKITLKNNTFDISSSCSEAKQGRKYIDESTDYKCNREYVIELVSKYNIWRGSDYRSRGITIETPLYDIHPLSSVVDKSTLKIYLKESELEKLLQSDSVKINFSLSFFSKKLLQQECDTIDARKEREYKRKHNPIPKYKSLDYILKERNKTPWVKAGFSTGISELKPSLRLNFWHIDLNNLKSDCSKQSRQCKQKLDSLNSPMNRLKRFFH